MSILSIQGIQIQTSSNNLTLSLYKEYRMYVAYSAFQQQAETNRQNLPSAQNELHLRYQAYQIACSKHSRYIAEIQKYFPGWKPEFR